MLRQMPDNHFFEIAKVFSDTGEESLQLAAVLSGSFLSSQYKPEQKALSTELFSHVKGLIENLSAQLNIDLQFKQTDTLHYFHPSQSLSILLGKKTIGHICLLHPNYLKTQQISEDTAYFELNLTELISITPTAIKYASFSRFPSTRRDVAFIVDKQIAFSSIEALIKQYKHKTLQRYFLFDHFESEQIGPNKKSMAIGFIYQDDKGTLADDKVTKCHEKLCQRLVSELNISIR